MNYYLWNNSPLDQFTINNLISFNGDILGSTNISLTNMGLFLTITTSIIFVFYLLANNYNLTTPNNWSLSLESVYSTVYSIVVNQ